MTPKPIFDSLEFIKDQKPSLGLSQAYGKSDYMKAKHFLLQYTGSLDTFNAYRREVERLLQWSWLVAKKSIFELRRQDISDYI